MSTPTLREQLTVGSLFAGIGGIDLGLEWTGHFRTVWQVERDDHARRVLARHWPGVRQHDDVRTFPPSDPADWQCDVIAGGFPCQDISIAGRGAGITGERSGLWSEFARIVRVVRPRIVVVENSPALANRGLAVVLGDLAGMGFDAEWGVLPASAFGACHIRARMFVVAYRQRGGRDGLHEREQAGRVAADARVGRADVPDRSTAPDPQWITANVSNIDSPGVRREGPGAVTGAAGGMQGEEEERERVRPDPAPTHQATSDPDRPRLAVREEHLLSLQQPAPVGSGWWAAEPDVVRMVHGFPGRVDRIRCLGNAVVPQVAEWIGRRIVEALA